MLLLPYVVLVLRTRLATMDPRVEEAARDLGAGRLRTARTVVLPQIAPALVAATVLAAAVSLDELVVTNFAVGGDATVPVWVLGQLRQGVTPAINAIAVLLLVVPLALVALAALLLRARGGAGLVRSVGR
jgi:ABC-type spermidine/putrescine transport system permease subunit II